MTDLMMRSKLKAVAGVRQALPTDAEQLAAQLLVVLATVQHDPQDAKALGEELDTDTALDRLAEIREVCALQSSGGPADLARWLGGILAEHGRVVPGDCEFLGADPSIVPAADTDAMADAPDDAGASSVELDRARDEVAALRRELDAASASEAERDAARSELAEVRRQRDQLEAELTQARDLLAEREREFRAEVEELQAALTAVLQDNQRLSALDAGRLAAAAQHGSQQARDLAQHLLALADQLEA